MQGYYIWHEDYYFGFAFKILCIFFLFRLTQCNPPQACNGLAIIPKIPIAILLLVDRFSVLDCNLKTRLIRLDTVTIVTWQNMSFWCLFPGVGVEEPIYNYVIGVFIAWIP